MIVMKCRNPKYVFCEQVQAKGNEAYAVRMLCQKITKTLVYNRIIMKSDQEPAIKELIKTQINNAGIKRFILLE